MKNWTDTFDRLVMGSSESLYQPSSNEMCKHHMSSTARPLADALWCPCSDFVIMPYKFIYYYRQAWAKHSHAGIVFTQ